MFQEPINFSYQRSWRQAIGWYLIFMLIGVALAAVVGKIAGIGTTTFSEGFNAGRPVGQIFGVCYLILLAALLLWPRPKDAQNILLAVGCLICYSLLGALVGLIPLAVLTTRPSLQSS
jgi:hypothetical protein